MNGKGGGWSHDPFLLIKMGLVWTATESGVMQNYEAWKQMAPKSYFQVRDDV